MCGKSNPVRRHGCQTPLHPFQILSWVVVTVFLAAFGGIVVPALWRGGAGLVVRVVVVAAFVLDGTVAIGLQLYLTLMDPSHPSLKQKRGELTGKRLRLATGQHVIDDSFFCRVCECNVGARTKHCGTCNRCVAVFDHHCIWLNNCIGAANYRTFLVYLASLLVAAVGQVALYGWMAVAGFLDHNAVPLCDCGPLVPIVATVLCLLSLAMLALVMQLVVLHTRLGLDGMTTYDRIMARKAIAEGREPPPHPRTLAGSGGSGGRRASCCCRGRSRRNPERSSRVGPAHTVRNGWVPPEGNDADGAEQTHSADRSRRRGISRESSPSAGVRNLRAADRADLPPLPPPSPPLELADDDDETDNDDAGGGSPIGPVRHDRSLSVSTATEAEQSMLNIELISPPRRRVSDRPVSDGSTTSSADRSRESTPVPLSSISPLSSFESGDEGVRIGSGRGRRPRPINGDFLKVARNGDV